MKNGEIKIFSHKLAESYIIFSRRPANIKILKIPTALDPKIWLLFYQLCSLLSKHSQIHFVCLNVLSSLTARPPCSSCFRYLLLCMARHAGSSTARDYCQCNWLFQAWFDTRLLSDPHTSLLSSVMERRWGSHETFTSSYLQRNRLLRFVSMLWVMIEKYPDTQKQTHISITHIFETKEKKLSWILKTNVIHIMFILCLCI